MTSNFSYDAEKLDHGVLGETAITEASAGLSLSLPLHAAPPGSNTPHQEQKHVKHQGSTPPRRHPRSSPSAAAPRPTHPRTEPRPTQSGGQDEGGNHS